MKEVVPAAGLAIQLLPVARRPTSPAGHASRNEPVLLSHGDCPIDSRAVLAS